MLLLRLQPSTVLKCVYSFLGFGQGFGALSPFRKLPKPLISLHSDTVVNYPITFQALRSTTMSTTSTQTITAENVIRLFPEVNTELAASHALPTDDRDLAGYDEEQIRLMDDVCIVLDENDAPIGSASKKVCRYWDLCVLVCELLSGSRSPHEKHQ